MAPYQGGWGSSHRQQQQFGRGQGGSKKEPWYETVKFDRSVNERPKWNLTSYAHQREKDNDVVGDISPEEVRYANMLSLQQGVHVSTLKDEFRKATRERVDVFQGLTRRRQAPSIEGRPMMARMDGIKNMSWVIQGHSAQGMGASFGQTGIQPSSGFGQPSTISFGQASRQDKMLLEAGGGGAAAAATAAGGSGFGGTFGQQPAQPSSGFGQASTASPFGQAGQNAFGAAAAAAQQHQVVCGLEEHLGNSLSTSSGFGQPSTASPFGQAGQNAFGAAAAATTSTAGSSSSTGFGGTFGQQPAQNLKRETWRYPRDGLYRVERLLNYLTNSNNAMDTAASLYTTFHDSSIERQDLNALLRRQLIQFYRIPTDFGMSDADGSESATLQSKRRTGGHRRGSESGRRRK
eukprot:jgi/Picre1/29111/NNA_004504.t1